MAKEVTAAKPKNKKINIFYRGGGVDMHFVVLLMIILIIGLATLFSASHVYAFNYNDGNSYFYIAKQAAYAVFGLVVMLIASYVDYHFLRIFAWPVWIISILLLVVARFMPSKTGVHRWIYIGSFQFQPSELAKFAIVLLFAYLISINYKRMKKITTGFLPFMLILGLTCVGVLVAPHLSGTLLVGLLGLAMMFIGGVNVWMLVGLFALAGAGLYLMVFVMGYEYDRILVWFHPLESYAGQIAFPEGANGRDMAWQTIQSLYAIGSGGLLGQGPGNSRQKHLFLPEPQNDFIFSVYCEEMGWVGAVLLLAVFALLVWRGFKIAMNAPDKFGCMLALGLTLQIGLQVAINVAVVTNLLPNTGISLPFFSYGGTSILMLMLQMGVVLSISRQSRMEKI